MDINHTAPITSRDDILIAATPEQIWAIHTDIDAWPSWRADVSSAKANGPIAVGATFDWTAGGMDITSTLVEVVPARRLVWTGIGPGIVAIHIWMLTPVDGGTRVMTAESFDGDAAIAHRAMLQPMLDGALRTWLAELKVAVEASRR